MNSHLKCLLSYGKEVQISWTLTNLGQGKTRKGLNSCLENLCWYLGFHKKNPKSHRLKEDLVIIIKWNLLFLREWWRRKPQTLIKLWGFLTKTFKMWNWKNCWRTFRVLVQISKGVPHSKWWSSSSWTLEKGPVWIANCPSQWQAVSSG